KFYENLPSKARPKHRAPQASDEHNLAQRLEAKLQAAEHKRMQILKANSQRRAILSQKAVTIVPTFLPNNSLRPELSSTQSHRLKPLKVLPFGEVSGATLDAGYRPSETVGGKNNASEWRGWHGAFTECSF
nr:hypothetical protein [Tanacetum cinerariifolium]